MIADLVCEAGTEAVYLLTDCFVTDIDPALMKQVFDVPPSHRKPDMHHHCELDGVGRCLEVAQR